MMPCYALVLSAEVDGIKPRNNPILGKDFFAEEVKEKVDDDDQACSLQRLRDSRHKAPTSLGVGHWGQWCETRL